jgi:hypothetical protein
MSVAAKSKHRMLATLHIFFWRHEMSRTRYDIRMICFISREASLSLHNLRNLMVPLRLMIHFLVASEMTVNAATELWCIEEVKRTDRM